MDEFHTRDMQQTKIDKIKEITQILSNYGFEMTNQDINKLLEICKDQKKIIIRESQR